MASSAPNVSRCFGPVGGQPDGLLSDADGLCREHQAAADHPALGQLEALTLAADEVLHRDLAIVELELGRPVVAEHRNWGHVHARRIGLNDEGAEAGTPARGVGAGIDHAEVSLVGIRGPHLASVEDVMVTAADGRGPEGTRGIGSAGRLADRGESAQPLLDRRLHVALDLILGARV